MIKTREILDLQEEPGSERSKDGHQIQGIIRVSSLLPGQSGSELSNEEVKLDSEGIASEILSGRHISPPISSVINRTDIDIGELKANDEIDASNSVGESELKDVKAGFEELCPVCGDKVSGYHYGLLTCESCKGFFKRTVQNKKVYSCVDNRSCQIDKSQRKRCPYCRFQKCLSVGMKLEAVRSDRMRGGRNKFGPMYKRDRALKQQAVRQAQALGACGDLPLLSNPMLANASTPGSPEDVKPDPMMLQASLNMFNNGVRITPTPSSSSLIPGVASASGIVSVSDLNSLSMSGSNSFRSVENSSGGTSTTSPPSTPHHLHHNVTPVLSQNYNLVGQSQGHKTTFNPLNHSQNIGHQILQHHHHQSQHPSNVEEQTSPIIHSNHQQKTSIQSGSLPDIHGQVTQSTISPNNPHHPGLTPHLSNQRVNEYNNNNHHHHHHPHQSSAGSDLSSLGSMSQSNVLEALRDVQGPQISVNQTSFLSPIIAEIKATTVDEVEVKHKMLSYMQNELSQTDITSNPECFLRVLCGMVDQLLFLMVEWARNSSFFKELKVEDQMKLLHNCWSEILILDFVYRQMNNVWGKELITPLGSSISIEILDSLGLGDVKIKLSELVKKVKELKMDFNEFMCLKFLILLNPDVSNLERRDYIEQNQEKVNAALFEYCMLCYPELTDKFGQLLMRLPEIRVISIRTEEFLYFKHLSNEVPDQTLLTEMLHAKRKG